MDKSRPIGQKNLPAYSKVSRRITKLRLIDHRISSQTSSAILTPMQDMTDDERGQYLEGLYEILTDELSEEEYLKRTRVFLEQMGK